MEKAIEICENNIIHKETVEIVEKQLPSDKKIESLSNFYKMFSDPTKAKILWALDINQMCVCDLAAICRVSKSAISHQLSLLKEANLVKSQREGKIVFYSLADSCVKEVLEKGVIHTINE